MKLADLREGLANYLQLPPHQLDGLINRLQLTISSQDLIAAGAQVKPQDPWCAGVDLIAAPTFVPHIGIYNPAGSGIDCFLRAIAVSSYGSTYNFEVEIGSTPPTDLGTAYYIDERLYPGAPAVGVRTQDVAGIVGVPVFVGRVSPTIGTFIWNLPRPIVLIPGRTLYVLGQTGQNLGAGFYWEEKRSGP